MTGKVKKAAGKVAKRDQQATHQAASRRDTPLLRVIGTLKEAADQPQLITACVGTIAVGLVARRSNLVRGGTRMLAAHLVATGVKSVLKHSIDRSRPRKSLQDGKQHVGSGKGGGDSDFNSFPSGHTAGAVAVARAATREFDGAAVPAALGAGAIAAAQPATGSHYLSDVLAGAVIGWLSEAIVNAAFERAAIALDHPEALAGEMPEQLNANPGNVPSER